MLDRISQALAEVIRTHANPGAAEDWVRIQSIHSDVNLGDGHLYLTLYVVGENPYLKNRGPVRGSDGLFRPPPLMLTLNYLITYEATADNGISEQTWLSRVLRVFHRHPRLGAAQLDGALAAEVDHLSVRLRHPGPEEVNQIWTALGRGMRLGLFYEVDAALIHSDNTTEGPILDREGTVARI